jgi:hypothetical protein
MLAGPALLAFGGLVPLAYYAAFFALSFALGGVWWNWNLIGGSLVWAALAGFALALLAQPSANREDRPAPRPPSSALLATEEASPVLAGKA